MKKFTKVEAEDIQMSPLGNNFEIAIGANESLVFTQETINEIVRQNTAINGGVNNTMPDAEVREEVERSEFGIPKTNLLEIKDFNYLHGQVMAIIPDYKSLLSKFGKFPDHIGDNNRDSHMLTTVLNASIINANGGLYNKLYNELDKYYSKSK